MSLVNSVVITNICLICHIISEIYAMTTLFSMFPANKTESNLVKVDGDRPKGKIVTTS